MFIDKEYLISVIDHIYIYIIYNNIDSVSEAFDDCQFFYPCNH